jgi:hypothetical protein
MVGTRSHANRGKTFDGHTRGGAFNRKRIPARPAQRSTEAFQAGDPGRAGVHLLAEAINGTGPSDVLTRIKRERVRTFFRTPL